jgi:hypothetical protein
VNIAVQAQVLPVAYPNNRVWTVYADSTTNKLYFYGSFDSLGTKHANKIGVYDLLTLQADSFPDGRIIDCDIWKIKRVDSLIYFLGALGWRLPNQTIQTSCYLTTDGLQWNLPLNPICDGNDYGADFLRDSSADYLSGGLLNVSGVSANMIASNNGIGWVPMDSIAIYPNIVYSVVKYKGELYAAGNFDNGTYSDIAKFNGTSWSRVGNPSLSGWGGVGDMLIYNGNLIVSGNISVAHGDPGDGVIMWDGNHWSPMGHEIFYVIDMVVFNGELYAGGYHSDPYLRLAKWSGTQWISVDSMSFNGGVESLSALGNSLFIGGQFDTINGQRIPYLAEYKHTVGVETITSLNTTKLDIYPSPVSSGQWIHAYCPEYFLSKNVFYEVMDEAGRTIVKRSATINAGSLDIDPGILPASMYMLRIISDQNIAFGKFIVR